MSNVTPINTSINKVDTRDIRTLSDEEVQVRAQASIEALHTAMDANDIAGALAALAGYANEIDIVSYLKVKMILANGMKDGGRVCYNPTLGWYDKADHPEGI